MMLSNKYIDRDIKNLICVKNAKKEGERLLDRIFKTNGKDTKILLDSIS